MLCDVTLLSQQRWMDKGEGSHMGAAASASGTSAENVEKVV